MFNRVLIFFAALAAFVCTSCVQINLPAEIETQQSTIFLSPVYENHVGEPSDDVQLPMIASILNAGDSVLFGQNPADLELPPSRDDYAAILATDYGVDPAGLARLTAIDVVHNDLWARDYMLIVNGTATKGGHGPHAGDVLGESLAMVDYDSNAWRYEEFTTSLDVLGYYEQDEQIDVGVAAELGLPVIESDLVIEGGALDSNGLGTVIVSEPAVTLGNPDLTLDEIKAEISRTTGATHVIALPFFHPVDRHGVFRGPLHLDDGTPVFPPITVEHDDNILRFGDDPGTIIIARLPQEIVDATCAARLACAAEQEIHDVLADVWTFMGTQVDQDGNPFRLVALPDPGLVLEPADAEDPMWDYMANGLVGLNGQSPGIAEIDPAGGLVAIPTGYINFVVTNHTIQVAEVAQPGREPTLSDRDAEAVAVLAVEFSGRAVYTVDTTNIGEGGGGAHCITSQVPGGVIWRGPLPRGWQAAAQAALANL